MSTQDAGQYLYPIRQNGLRLNANEPLVAAGSATFSGASTFTGAVTFSGSTGGGLKNVVDVTGTTLAPTAAQSGTTFMLDSAGSTNALVVTLPTPVVGLSYGFVVTTAATGTYTYKIYTGSASIFMVGVDVVGLGTEGDVAIFNGNGTTPTYFDMNGTTTGGLIGTTVEVLCLTTTLWRVNAYNFASGSIATSYATS